MAYHGYFEVMKAILSHYQAPSVLEIGVDKGQTLLPLLHILSLEKKRFTLAGCDIYVRQELQDTLFSMTSNLTPEQDFRMFNKSSLELLPEILDAHSEYLKTPYGVKQRVFNMVLIDGDHNYYTVEKELKYVSKLLSEYGIIIFDDYHGRWSEKDEYFSELEEYKKQGLGTPNQNTEKKGVKPAVDEFIQENPEWEMNHLFEDFEPVLIYRKGYWNIECTKREDIDGRFHGHFQVSLGPKFLKLLNKEKKE